MKVNIQSVLFPALIIAIFCFNYKAKAKEAELKSIVIDLDLALAMDLGEKNSLNLKEIRSDYDTLNSQHTLSFFQSGPTLEVGSETTWYPRRDSYNLNANTEADRQTSVSLTVIQPITNIWKNYYNIKELSAKKSAAAYDLSTEKIKIRIEAAQAFLEAQQALSDVEIKKADYENANLQYKDTAILFETGDDSKDKIDLLLMQANSVKAQVDFENAKNIYTNRLENLKKVLNIFSDAKINIKNIEASYFEKQNLAIKDIESLLQESKKARPDLKSIEQSLTASKAAINQNTFKFLPEISAFTKYNNDESFNNESGLNNSNTGNNSSANGFSFGVRLSWTLWDGGISLASRTEMNNRQEKNKLNHEKKLILIREEVTTYYNNLTSSLLLLPQTKQLASLYNESYKLSQVKYKTGNLNASELIKTQNDSTNAKMALAKLRGDIDNNWLKLQSAIGSIPSYSNKRLLK